MLAELKDLAQKSLFTQVRRAKLALYSQHKFTSRVGGSETHFEKTDSVRNSSRASGCKEERLFAVCSVRNGS